MTGKYPTFLSEWRDYCGFSQEDLEAKIGWSHGQISKIENGRHQYSRNFLEAAAKAMEVTPSELLGRDPRDPDALWFLCQRLPESERHRAAELLKALLRSVGVDPIPPQGAAALETQKRGQR